MREVKGQIFQIVASTFDVKKSEIGWDSTWTAYKVDSLDLVELILAVEEEFQVSFEPADLKRILSVGDLVRAVEAKLKPAD